MTDLQKIICQGKNCKQNGCYSCGGYGYVLEQVKLGCGCVAWFRPGNYTTYEGKIVESRDALTCKVQKDWTLWCVKCLEAKGSEGIK